MAPQEQKDKPKLPKLATASPAIPAQKPAQPQNPPAPAAFAAKAREESYSKSPVQTDKQSGLLKSGKRLATGIPGLDEQIEGGIEEQTVGLVSGDSGCGKTTFCLQFLYNGAVKNNEPGIFITFEEKKRDIYRHAARFGWDFAKLEKEKKFTILEYAPHEIDRFITEGQVIEDLIREIGAKRLAIDSITSLALVFENEYKRRQGLVKTLGTLRKWGCTTIISSEAQVLPNGEIRARFGLSYLSDALFYLYNFRRGDRRTRAFEVMKMRGTKHATSIVPLQFTDSGLEIYPNQPVFGASTQL